jgi:RNA polymerase sigma-70 factor (ECF subfamily)
MPGVRGVEMKEMSDAALVVAVGRWNQDALAEVFRRHSGAVFVLARRVLQSQAHAEEIMQDVFLRLWDRPEGFDPARGSLRSYLLSQTHGRSVDMVRSELAQRRRQETEAQRAVVSDYDLEREVGDVIVAEQVRDALACLTAGEREAIELAYFGGRTYREVSALLNEPEGTVKSRIRTGLRRLREALADAGVEAS